MKFMRCMLTALALPWSVCSYGQTVAAFLNSNQLYDECIVGPGTVDDAACYSYVIGVADALLHTNTICVPDGVTIERAKDVVIKYLRDNPDKRQYTAASNVTVALTYAFPCKR
jgi:hypothetical protein